MFDYLGSHQYYNGGPTILATSGQVQVRLWTANDFPEPDFTNAFNMDTTGNYFITRSIFYIII